MKRADRYDCRWLSQETRVAKQLRRRLERRYSRTGSAPNNQAHNPTVAAAHDSITKSRADNFRSLIEEARDDQYLTNCCTVSRQHIIVTITVRT